MILPYLLILFASQQPVRLFERSERLFRLLGDATPITSGFVTASNGRLEVQTEYGSRVWWFPGREIGGFLGGGPDLSNQPFQKREMPEIRAAVLAVYQAVELAGARGLLTPDIEWELFDPRIGIPREATDYRMRFRRAGIPLYQEGRVTFDHRLGYPTSGRFLWAPLPTRVDWRAKISDLSAGTVAHAWVRGKVERPDALVESDLPELIWLDPRYTRFFGPTSVNAEYLELCWKVRFLAYDSPHRQIGEVLVDARTGKVLRTFRAPLSMGGGSSPAKPEAWGAPKRIEFGGKTWKVANAEETAVPKVAKPASATVEFADGIRTLSYDPKARVLWRPGLDKAWKVRLGSRS